MKYNLFEIIGIYVVVKNTIVLGSTFVKSYTKAKQEIELKRRFEELKQSAEMLDKFNDELKRRDKMVLDMYREGYSRQEILDHFGEKWIGKEDVQRICDEEDNSWDAEA